MQFKSVALVASAILFAACGGGSDTPATEAPAAEMTPAAAPAGRNNDGARHGHRARNQDGRR